MNASKSISHLSALGYTCTIMTRNLGALMSVSVTVYAPDMKIAYDNTMYLTSDQSLDLILDNAVVTIERSKGYAPAD